MEKTRSHYLKYEVAADPFCLQAVTGINYVTSDFFVSCCYFGQDKQMNSELSTHLIDVVPEEYIFPYTMFNF